MAELKELLGKLGADQSTIDAIEKGEKTFDEIITAHELKIREAVENDGDFRKSIVTPEVNKILGTLDNDLKKRWGLKPEDLAGKPLHEKLDLVKAAYDEALKNGSKGDSVELQEKLVGLQGQLEKYDKEIIPQIKSEASNQISQYKIGIQLRNIWDAVPQDKVLVDKSVAYDVVEVFINKNYDTKIGDDGNIKFTQKGTDLKPQFGNEVISDPAVLISRILKEKKLEKVHTGGGGQPPKTTPSGGGGNGVINADIQKRKEQMQAKFGIQQ